MRRLQKDHSVRTSPVSVRPEPVDGLASSAEKDKCSAGAAQTEKREKRKLGVRFG